MAYALSVYDRLRPHLDPEGILRRLGAEIVRRIGSEAYCRPLCHESASGESLQVNLHTGRWNCKACQHAGMSGDMIQFVEYWITGGRSPSHGDQQRNSPTHREAIRWLCEQFAVPFELGKLAGDPALDVVHMFSMLAHEHLLRSPDVLAWVQEKWGFDRATVEAYGIGFMPSPILPQLVAEASRSESRDAFRASGIGFYSQGGRFETRFAGRITFPYLEHGRAVYLIGRATPWTPALDNGAKPPKYHKLTVHSAERPYISERITNDHLYNEPVLAGTDVVVVAEGVADAVALSSLGAPVVSPVTISFNKNDLARFIEKCKANGIRRVEIVFDNELSGSGGAGAERVADKLVEHGLCVSIVTLPLGPKQEAARAEVLSRLGPELFAQLEASDPQERKRLIAAAFPDETERAWLLESIQDSKIDAAEWVALEGAGAAGKFNALRRSALDVVVDLARKVGRSVDPEASVFERVSLFTEVIRLAASVDERLARAEYAGEISKAIGKGITKAEVLQRIAGERRMLLETRKEAEKEERPKEAGKPSLVLLPPDAPHVQPSAPPPPPGAPGAPQAPPAPRDTVSTEHDRYAPVRDSVGKAVEKKVAEELIGRHVAQTITLSMGFTVFRTPEDLVLIRGSERVDVGGTRLSGPFRRLIYMASGLTVSKSAHRSYIDSAVYFLDLEATQVRDVSWSHFDEEEGAVYFPTGDTVGRILRIVPGRVERTRMSEAKVPAVAGRSFRPISYVERHEGGIADVLDLLRWISISPSDRLLLVYWTVCLPILRRIGEVPIVRIEGGSSSGKTRAVDAISFLVNGCKSSSVPTAAALTSGLSREMLTIDDNRESRDMNDSLRSTLLQATGLGAREKRRGSSDTETVIERACGALLMNGIEPIHDGRSELASRMLTLRSDSRHRSADSPVANSVLYSAILSCRDRFWSEAVLRCAAALEMDQRWGEPLGLEIESIFGSTRIGRLSAYLRLTYLAWVAGEPMETRQGLLDRIAVPWARAFADVAGYVLQSLMHEELAVSAMRYAFAHAHAQAKDTPGSDERLAYDGRYRESIAKGDAYLGPVSSAQLARLVRAAGKDMNAPRAITVDLTAGQLLARIQDGLGFLSDAGFDVELLPTQRGKVRLVVYRRPRTTPEPLAGDQATPPAGDSWSSPE